MRLGDPPLTAAEVPGALAELRRRPVSFDERDAGRPGGHVDDLCWALAPEPPGPPVPDGSWERARAAIEGYRIVDGSAVRAFFDPEEPAARRTLLLELRFLGLRFRVGVRAVALVDETREVGGRPLRVWRWSYRTLAGHVERGQMDYAVWKWLDSGAVELRLHAVSRRARVDSVLVRLGLRLFARREQLRFYRHVGERVAALGVG
jgi:uncharacterized protein (UPF0548 family)